MSSFVSGIELPVSEKKFESQKQGRANGEGERGGVELGISNPMIFILIGARMLSMTL